MNQIKNLGSFRKYIIRLCLLVFLLPGLSKVTIVTLYFTANDYFVEQFCVNADQADSCCRGKCFIKEELTNQEPLEENTPNNISELEIKLEFIKPVTSICISQENWHNCAIKEDTLFTSKDFISEVFRPPIC